MDIKSDLITKVLIAFAIFYIFNRFLSKIILQWWKERSENKRNKNVSMDILIARQKVFLKDSSTEKKTNQKQESFVMEV